MPIRPENRSRYPQEWPAIRARIRERAGDRCEQCGKRNRVTYMVVWDGSGRYLDDYVPADAFAPDGWEGVWRDRTGAECPSPEPCDYHETECVLTTAHLNHEPEDCRDENLKLLCQSCHLKHDAEHHARTRRISRRISREAAGQQAMLVEAKETP